MPWVLLTTNISMRAKNYFVRLVVTELKTKLVEIDTLRESLCKQVDNLYEQFAEYLPSEACKY